MANETVTVKIKGLDELKKAMEKSPKTVREHLDPAIKKAILSLKAKAIPETSTDRGFLRGSNHETFSTLKGILENTAPYSSYVHDGTKPHFPPISAIEGWANRHGIEPFLVARAISKKGTKAVPFYDNAIKGTVAILDNIFDTALLKITESLAK